MYYYIQLNKYPHMYVQPASVGCVLEKMYFSRSNLVSFLYIYLCCEGVGADDQPFYYCFPHKIYSSRYILFYGASDSSLDPFCLCIHIVK